MRVQEFNYSIDVIRALLWQYDNSPNIKALLQGEQTWLDGNQQAFWSDWYDNVFNLETANDFGLSVWSIILGLPLFLDLNPAPETAQIFGFNDFTGAPINDYYNFNNGTFAPDSQPIVLTSEQERFVLRLRYFQLTTRCDLTSANAFLNDLIESSDMDPVGQIYVMDNLDMSITYVFNFDVPHPLRRALVEYDLLPRPAGVKINYIVTSGQIFGFNNFSGDTPENSYFNFNNGTFPPESFL